MVALIKREDQPAWKHLVPVVDKIELYLRGRKLPAFSVWKSILTEGYTPQEAADNWELSVEAVKEAVAYCEVNQELFAYLAKEELRIAQANGVSFGPETAC